MLKFGRKPCKTCFHKHEKNSKMHRACTKNHTDRKTISWSHRIKERRMFEFLFLMNPNSSSENLLKSRERIMHTIRKIKVFSDLGLYYVNITNDAVQKF